MKTRYSFMDPGVIMGIVVSLRILGVGVFAFFVTVGAIGNTNPPGWQIQGDYLGQSDVFNSSVNRSRMWNLTQGNLSSTGNQVFNIVGIVMIIGAIMAIVGLVYNYVR